LKIFKDFEKRNAIFIDEEASPGMHSITIILTDDFNAKKEYSFTLEIEQETKIEFKGVEMEEI
jgi:hypothetical protein